ncbi:NAD(P)/FAD-dependent oxidoreductase [Kribbella sp. NPDC051586]|uniref:NAD(P)/FAD-dependent oxidoreductase n=1 Tax=Kribbella sp. NPDC051586 TaxID=3364118 RepID=UPI0037A589D0
MVKPRVVIVGAGFAGFHAARRLSRVARGRAEVVVVNPTDYFLYVPLLPEVASGILEPRHVTVSLAEELPGVRLVLGEVDGLDLESKTVRYADPTGAPGELGYDRLVIAAGSVNKLLPIPGVAEYAHGFRGIPEAVFLRDHLTQQIELADATDDQAERDALCTFVVVGAGYTGTEVAAHGVLYTALLQKRHPRLSEQRMRWMLLDVADRVLPELDERLSRTADAVLRERGVDVRMGVSVEEAAESGVRLTDDSFVPTRSLIWCVGVRPDPVVDGLGLKTDKGRLVVDEYLQVPGHPEVFACGDAAAVPDLTRPGEVTPMTAQHAERQGKQAADNVAASFGTGELRPYKHHDLGFVVDLGGTQAAANPLHVPLAGLPAKAVTRGYHLLSMPGNRIRTATEWLYDAVLPRQTTQLGVIPAESVPLDTAAPEHITRGRRR